MASERYPSRARAKEQYMQDFINAVAEINKSVQATRPSGVNRYDRVSVLGVHWENDNIGLKPLTHELLDVFRKLYRFETQLHEIRVSDSRGNPLSQALVTQGVVSALYQWANKADPRVKTLNILFYGGHAACVKSRPSSPTLDQFRWSGDQGPIYVDFWAIRQHITAAPADDLWILGCCNATSASIDTQMEAEVLCACGFESVTTASMQLCFTQNLIDILRAKATSSITISEIAALMVQDVLKTNLTATPWYGKSYKQEQVTLQAQHIREVVELAASAPQSKGRVAVKVSVTGISGTPDHSQFVQWITTNVPQDVGEITVEAIFPSYSYVCILTMPTRVWLCLPDDKGFEFVAHVTGRNLLLPEAMEEETQLGEKRSNEPTGKENLPFRPGQSGGASSGSSSFK